MARKGRKTCVEGRCFSFDMVWWGWGGVGEKDESNEEERRWIKKEGGCLRKGWKREEVVKCGCVWVIEGEEGDECVNGKSRGVIRLGRRARSKRRMTLLRFGGGGMKEHSHRRMSRHVRGGS